MLFWLFIILSFFIIVYFIFATFLSSKQEIQKKKDESFTFKI